MYDEMMHVPHEEKRQQQQTFKKSVKNKTEPLTRPNLASSEHEDSSQQHVMDKVFS